MPKIHHLHPLEAVRKFNELVDGVNNDLLSRSIEKWLFLATTVVVFLYLLARAAMVPLVHDEARTFFDHIYNGTWIPFLAPWDAGNHVLVMAVGQFTSTLFGPDPLVLRSFSVICFAFYAWYVWRISRSIHEPVIRNCIGLTLITIPYLIEFFGLFRGYGPSFCFLLMAAYHLSDTDRYGKFAAWPPILLGLGVLCNLSLLPVWSIGMAIHLILLWLRNANTLPRILMWCLGLAPGILMIVFAHGLQVRDRLYFGTESGLFHGSLNSLTLSIADSDSVPLRLFICFMVLAAPIAAIGLYLKRKDQRSILFMIIVLFLV
ncbi:MAG: hypothetical protein M3R08_03460, partial [Bacteroidota bacterium]|nr:hypothetical protein [Bacteroidota bacterium]